ncbi:MAG TPA: hypothetical protein DCK79_04975 [Candidatus Atribacteria bacterium]|jgi:ribose transport system substrate-binding protein|nr:hypothetical protein [Candidatus Atribacteria bacterium]
MKRYSLILLVLVLATTIVLATTTVFAAEVKKEDIKIGLIGVLHPYFAPWEQIAKDYMNETGIEVGYRATQHFDQEEENAIIEAMQTQGYNGFAIWPGHYTACNVTIAELAKQGIPVVAIAGPVALPTDAALYIDEDTKKSVMKSTEELIKAMGGKGNIVSLLGALSDPDTILRKEGVDEVVARYPGVKIIAELADIDALEDATTKIGSLLGAREKEIDGIIATCYVPTLVAIKDLTEIGDKRIKLVGVGTNSDPENVQAIKDGYMTGYISQSPLAQAWLGMEAIRLLKSGYTVKKGAFFVEIPNFYTNIDNVDNYQQNQKDILNEMLRTFATDYFNPPKK